MTKLEQAAAAVAAARAAYADADLLRSASHPEIVDLLTVTSELARVVDAQRVRLAGAIAERSKGPDDESIGRLLGAHGPREATARAFGIRGNDAAALLKLAAATETSISITGDTIAIKYPRVARALDDAEISVAQAQTIIGALEPAAPRADLTQLGWAEGCLVDAATDPEAPLVPELLATQARAFVAVLDPDGVLPDSERQRDLRSLRIWQDRDGTFRFSGSCPAEKGSAFKSFLDAYTSPRVAFRDDACEAESGDAVGDVAPETATEGVGAPAAAATAPPVDDRTLPQKRHDVLMALVEGHLASGEAPIAGGEVPTLVLTGTIEAFDAYVRGIEHPDRALTIEHTGAIVPIETADRLLCDAVVQRAVVDAEGHVLELGREQRTFSRAQRRALAVQYGGCAAPGCGLPVAWTEAHHVIWWSHGGPTDTAYGILLCSYHHHEVHARRLRIVGEPGHWRVVAQLQPSDRYARSRRTALTTGEALARGEAAVARASIAHAAPVPLAVRLPDPDPRSSRMRQAATPPGFGHGHPSNWTVAPSLRRARRRRMPTGQTAGRSAGQMAQTGLVEARLRERVPIPALAGRRSRHRLPRIDLGPPAHIVMRT